MWSNENFVSIPVTLFGHGTPGSLASLSPKQMVLKIILQILSYIQVEESYRIYSQTVRTYKKTDVSFIVALFIVESRKSISYEYISRQLSYVGLSSSVSKHLLIGNYFFALGWRVKGMCFGGPRIKFLFIHIFLLLYRT